MKAKRQATLTVLTATPHHPQPSLARPDCSTCATTCPFFPADVLPISRPFWCSEYQERPKELKP